MAILFYPNQEDISNLSKREKLELMREAAERYKSIILQISTKTTEITIEQKKDAAPRDITHAYNWDELAKLLRELRELPENNSITRLAKAEHLIKLAEIYEVLRGAKMPKLEAVRLALVNEATHLKSAANSSAV